MNPEDRFRRQLLDALETRRRLLETAARGLADEPAEARRSIRRVAHGLRGAAAMTGFTALSELAADTENADDADLPRRLEALLDAIRELSPEAAEPASDVLVVEDDATTRLLLETCLAGAGRRVRVAETGAEALRVAGEGALAMVVLDLGLPDRDGREVLAELRGLGPHRDTPVMVVSGAKSALVRRECFLLGACAFVEKPFGAREFMREFDAHMTRREAEIGRDTFAGLLRLPSRNHLARVFPLLQERLRAGAGPLTFALLAFEDGGDEPALEATARRLGKDLPRPDLLVRWDEGVLALLLPSTTPGDAERALATALGRGRGGRAGRWVGAAVEVGAADDLDVLADAWERTLFSRLRGGADGFTPLRGAAAAPPRVLLVEDDDLTRDILEDRLLKAGFRVDLAADGVAALARATGGDPPDLVLLDLRLPRLDGIGFLERFQATPGARRVPVLILTALADEDQVLAGLAAGAADYLVKPVGARVLEARIWRALGR